MLITISISDITMKNGTERAVSNLANILVKYGNYKVIIISIFSTETSKPAFELDARVSIAHLGQNRATLLSRQRAYKIMNDFILSLNKNDEKIVALGTDYGDQCAICKLPSLIRKVVCMHINYASVSFFRKIFRKHYYKRADAIVLLTKSDAEHYTFIKLERRFVIPNSLSFVPKRCSDILQKRIICVGRLTYQKGFDILIENAKRIQEQISDWHIEIFGDGIEKKKLLHLIYQNNLSDFVTLNGYTENIESEFLSSGIYLMTSRYEGLPMVLLEAKICGLPIVSFNCPEGPADVIKNNEDGFLVDFMDCDGLVAKVVELAKDENLRKRFSVAAKNNAMQYAPEKIFEKWQMLLNSMDN